MSRLLISILSMALFVASAVAMESQQKNDELGSQLVNHVMICARPHGLEVRRLVAAGADVNYVTKDGKTALIWAAKNSDVKSIQLLLDANAHVNHREKSGWTALMWAVNQFRAVDSKRSKCVRLLINAGADVYLGNKKGWTPWMWAHDQTDYELLTDAMIRSAKEHRERIYIFLNCLKKAFDRGTYRNLCHVFRPCLEEQIKELSPYVKIMNQVPNPKIKIALLEKYYPNNLEANK